MTSEKINSTPTAHPIYTAEEARNRETFLALMWALSYPGKLCELPSVNPSRLFPTLAESLLDLETSYFTPDEALSADLRRTGARALPADRAAYHFYPAVTEASLSFIDMAAVGSAAYPDESATLFLGCTSGTLGMADADTELVLQGPGIHGESRIRFSGIPQAIWALRERHRLYPIGWDIFLVEPSGKVVGLPRSTSIRYGN